MAAIGGVVGVALFCVCEVVPYIVRRVRRGVANHQRRNPEFDGIKGKVQFALTKLRAGSDKVQRLYRGAPHAPLAKLLDENDIIDVVVTYLRISDACLLRGASTSVKASPWSQAFRPRIYVFGGHPNLASVESLEQAAVQSCWQVAEPMPHSRFWATGAAVGGRMYMCGGTSGGGALSSCDCFDPDHGTWENLPDMLQRRVWPACCAIAGCLYVFGGRDGNRVLDAVEVYDVAVSQWERLEPMNVPRYGATAAALRGFAFVCGGGIAVGADDTSALNSVERCGGRCGCNALKSTEILDPERANWELDWEVLETSTMSVGRYGAMSAVLGGRIYVMGGRAGHNSSALRSVEVFHPVRGWAAAPSLVESRVWSVGVSMVERSNG